MRKRFLLSAILLATAPLSVAATEFWVRHPEDGSCSLNSMGLQLWPAPNDAPEPAARAVQILFSPEMDVALLAQYVPHAKVGSLSAVTVNFRNKGNFTDGTTAVRVLVDGATIPAAPEPNYTPSAMRSVQWLPQDEKKWLNALFVGKVAKVDFVDDGGRTLGTRLISIAPIMSAHSEIENIRRWKC